MNVSYVYCLRTDVKLRVLLLSFFSFTAVIAVSAQTYLLCQKVICISSQTINDRFCCMFVMFLPVDKSVGCHCFMNGQRSAYRCEDPKRTIVKICRRYLPLKRAACGLILLTQYVTPSSRVDFSSKLPCFGVYTM